MFCIFCVPVICSIPERRIVICEEQHTQEYNYCKGYDYKGLHKTSVHSMSLQGH